MHFCLENFRDTLAVRRNQDASHIFDVELANLPQLRRFDCLDYHIVAYPYSRHVNSKHITFQPFEEYVNDISTRRRSAYIPIESALPNILSVLLEALIALISRVDEGESSNP